MSESLEKGFKLSVDHLAFFLLEILFSYHVCSICKSKQEKEEQDKEGSCIDEAFEDHSNQEGCASWVSKHHN